MIGVFRGQRVNLAASNPLTSQSRTVPSELALASVLPSGEKLTLLTLPICPVNVFMFSPVFTSHKRTVPSELALAIFFSIW